MEKARATKKVSNKASKWASADDVQGEPSASGVLVNIEEMMKDTRPDVYAAYQKAITAAGGKKVSAGDRLKIAGYVYFCTPSNTRGEAFVKKPMIMLKGEEKTDAIRAIGIKKWGNVQRHPARSLTTSETFKAWSAALSPVPRRAGGRGSFFELDLDSRIRWAHLCTAVFHARMSRVAKSGRDVNADADESILLAMEKTCSQMGIPPFPGPYRDPEFIRYVIDCYAGMMLSEQIASLLKGLEESPTPKGIKHDAKVKTFVNNGTREDGGRSDFYGKMLRTIMPTLRSHGREDQYKLYLKKVKDAGMIVCPSVKFKVAEYVIAAFPPKNAKTPNVLKSIIDMPDCLVKADRILSGCGPVIEPVGHQPTRRIEGSTRPDQPSINAGWGPRGKPQVSRPEVSEVKPAKAPAAAYIMMLRVNGKTIGRITVDTGATLQEVETAAITEALRLKRIPSKKVKKIVVSSKGLVNIVTERPKR